VRRGSRLSVRLVAFLALAVVAVMAAGIAVLRWETTASDRAGLPRAPTPTRGALLVIAVIGDYGECAHSPCLHERAVATLVHSWHLDAIFTVGDNSYDNGAATEVAPDQQPYAGDVAAGIFYQVTGNHDWGTGSLQASTDYFHRPAHYVAHLGHGLIDFFATDMNAQDPDGDGADSAQAAQFRRDLAASTARWVIVGSHQPFYSSGHHGTQAYTHWAIQPRVDLFLSGHDHDFEHLVVGGQHFVVNGAGGSNEFRAMCANGCVAGSVFQNPVAYGAVRLTVTESSLTVEFITVDGLTEHAFTLVKEAGL
jgi:tartrate-resistant acid phosphatase type 5